VASIVTVGFEVVTLVGLEVVTVGVITVGFKVGITTAVGSIVTAAGANEGLLVLPEAEDPTP
jgi:hypothetical protein